MEAESKDRETKKSTSTLVEAVASQMTSKYTQNRRFSAPNSKKHLSGKPDTSLPKQNYFL
jgi:hypothetical protein